MENTVVAEIVLTEDDRIQLKLNEDFLYHFTYDKERLTEEFRRFKILLDDLRRMI